MTDGTRPGVTEGLRPDEFIVPTGFDLVKVQVGESDEVRATCSQCGGSSLHTAAACIYCGVARTHYEYQKRGSRSPGKVSRTPGQITVAKGSLEGAIHADEVRIEVGSVVGSIIATDNTYLEDDSRAGSIFSPIVTTKGKVIFTELATSVLDCNGGRVFANQVTIYNGGRMRLPRFSPIQELRLGVGVAEPVHLVQIAIGSIIRGDFPVPQEWKK